MPRAITTCSAGTKEQLNSAVERINAAAGRRLATITGLIDALVAEHLPETTRAIMQREAERAGAAAANLSAASRE